MVRSDGIKQSYKREREQILLEKRVGLFIYTQREERERKKESDS